MAAGLACCQGVGFKPKPAGAGADSTGGGAGGSGERPRGGADLADGPVVHEQDGLHGGSGGGLPEHQEGALALPAHRLQPPPHQHLRPARPPVSGGTRRLL